MSASGRILCVVDGPNWIFKRHVQAFKRYLGDEFEFALAYRGHEYDEDAFDLIYPLEFNMVEAHQIHNPAKYVTGIRSFVSWADWDFLELVNYLNQHFQSVHVVSRELYNLFQLYINNLWYVTHGVDVDAFTPGEAVASPAGQLRLGWAGNRATIIKGFRDFIQPLASIAGVELVYYGFADRNLSQEEMPAFYNSIDSYVCASSFEGNNNTLLEAAAMERAIITTPCGTVPEYLENEISALIIERKLEQFESAVVRLRDDPQCRNRLGSQARQAILSNGWDWASKAEEYQRFFRQALQHAKSPFEKPGPVEVFDYQHLSQAFETQYRLERELRIGYAFNGIELQYQLDQLKGQLGELQGEITQIKESETYKIVSHVRDNSLAKRLFNLYARLRK